MPHGQPITYVDNILYRTTATCATKCTTKIFFTRTANHYHRIPCSQPSQSASTPPTNVGAKYYSPETQPATPHALFATRPSAPTPPSNVGAKYFSPESQPSNPSFPVLNPTLLPQHHQPTCGRKIFRPYNILPICLIPVTTQPFCPTPPATVGARCAGVTRPRPPQRLYLAKSI